VADEVGDQVAELQVGRVFEEQVQEPEQRVE
jgi:hypothetical protein